jgi:two-component system alkaline phosphatase synthesis response regulator PhoP
MQHKILLVEDEDSISEILKLNLNLEGYDCTIKNNGEEGLTEALTGNYNLIILDVMLPKISGYEICEQIRKKGITTPILFLTALGDTNQKIKGLKLGADDYLAKPFDLEEFLLRVYNLLKRFTIEQTDSTIKFGENCINFETFEAQTFENKSIKLTKKEALLLRFLIEHVNKTVSRNDILDKIWGYDTFPTTRTIDNFILEFRKHFEKDSKNPEYFLSIRGVGYMFKYNFNE